MRYARVKAGACSALGNRVFLIGDKVNEDNFHKGIFDQYIESGHLEIIGKDDKKASSPDPVAIEISAKKSEDPSKEVSEDLNEEEVDKVDTEEDATKKEIMEQLDELGIKYKKTMSKNELYDLWKAAK